MAMKAMTVKQLIKALQSLKDDENAKIADCEVRIYPTKNTVIDQATLIDYDVAVVRVERDRENACPEITLYVEIIPA